MLIKSWFSYSFYNFTFTGEYFNQYICYDTSKIIRTLCAVFKTGIAERRKSGTNIVWTKFIDEFVFAF